MLKRFCLSTALSSDDWEDIFQEACVILMENIKQGKFVERPGSTLFSYFVEIGKRTMQTALRKKAKHHPAPQKEEGTPHLILLWGKPASESQEEDGEVLEISVEEKQTQQNEFLDRVFDSIPDACKTLLKKFYWDHKPMDEIASILGMRNADSAKSKKSKCMNKVKDIAAQLIESEEFAEDAIRNAVERAALKALLAEEITYADGGFCMAALDTDDKNKKK